MRTLARQACGWIVDAWRCGARIVVESAVDRCIGGGVNAGTTYGATDEYGYNIIENPLSVHDLHATILNQLGVNHERLTFKFQGRHYRLTDLHGEVIAPLLNNQS